MPELVKSSVGSLPGTRLDERTIVWPFDSKNLRNFSRISAAFIRDWGRSRLETRRPRRPRAGVFRLNDRLYGNVAGLPLLRMTAGRCPTLGLPVRGWLGRTYHFAYGTGRRLSPLLRIVSLSTSSKALGEEDSTARTARSSALSR